MRPTSAFIQATHVSPRLAVSSPSCRGTEATSPWSDVAPGAVGCAGWVLPSTTAWPLKLQCREGGDEPQDWNWLHAASVSLHLALVSRSQCWICPTHLCGRGAAQRSMRGALVQAAPHLRWHESGHVGAVIQENLSDASLQVLGWGSGGDVLGAPSAAAAAAPRSWSHAWGHGDVSGSGWYER